VSKKLEQKQARRLEQERRKAEHRKEALRRNLITIVVAIVVAVAVIFAITSEKRSKEAPVGVPTSEAGCDPIEEFPAQQGQHIEEGAQHDPYNSDPPTSGPHYATPADTGFYTAPLRTEQVVHNLEHGQIVIWYADDLSAENQSLIEEITDDERNATVSVPYSIDPKYQIVLTAWLAGEKEGDNGTGIMQGCAAISQEAVNEFRTNYQGKGPEPFTPPFSG
jgi:hypothetical protein